MCCKKVNESHIDISLIFSHARSKQFGLLAEFISAPNVDRIQDRGREVLRRGHARGRQDPLQLRRQLRAARDMPGAPRPASGHTCSTTDVFVCSTSFLLDVEVHRDIRVVQQLREGLSYFLGSVLLKTEGTHVHSMYIEAAKVGNLQDVERVTREDEHFPRSAWPTSTRRCTCPTIGRASTSCATALTWSTDRMHHLYSNNMFKYT